jgi:hypothetical protein
MKTDDCWRIVLDEEEFRKYAATDEPKRFIMSLFPFHSLYILFPFTLILEKSSHHYPSFHCNTRVRSPGISPVFCNNQCETLIDKFTPPPQGAELVIYGKNRTQWHWRGKRNITEILIRNMPVLCNVGWETDNVRMHVSGKGRGVLNLPVNVAVLNHEFKCKIKLRYEI